MAIRFEDLRSTGMGRLALAEKATARAQEVNEIAKEHGFFFTGSIVDPFGGMIVFEPDIKPDKTAGSVSTMEPIQIFEAPTRKNKPARKAQKQKEVSDEVMAKRERHDDNVGMLTGRLGNTFFRDGVPIHLIQRKDKRRKR